ncbi:MAG: GNAT family N-acetyltransferase [Anaerolineales bacterium]|nr:GNAT family N-acetyltransferase [Anaerolineales bacterium]
MSHFVRPCGEVIGITQQIQKADLRDWFAAWHLERACFGPDAWGLLELGLALLTPGIRLKAVVEEQLVGLVIAERNVWTNEGLIATLAVHPDFQRQGLGRRLLAEAEARLNTPRIRLTVRASNAAAIALYEQAGYRRAGRAPRYYAHGEDGVVMEKVVGMDGHS